MSADKAHEIRSLIKMTDFMAQSVTDLDLTDHAVVSSLQATKALLVKELVYLNPDSEDVVVTDRTGTVLSNTA